MSLISRLLDSKPTIFVQIAAYRDPELRPTLHDLYAKATHPERVYVGVCLQYDKEVDAPIVDNLSPHPARTRIAHVDALDSQGVCWARLEAQKLYRNEDYVLMIDSHMRFVQGWDEMMIAELARCPSKKPMITHYPPGYVPPDTLVDNPRPTVSVMKPFKSCGGIRARGIVLNKPLDEPLRGAFVSGGYMFARGAFLREVPYDPYMYFAQEEVSLGLRAFTHGWDVYHPTNVTLFHYYRKPDSDPNKLSKLHWEDSKNWSIIRKRAEKRFAHLVRHTISTDADVIKDLDMYGLGTERTLEEFEAFSGLDFKARIASERAQEGLFMDNIMALRGKSANPAAKKRPALSALAVDQFLPPFALKDEKGKTQEAHLFAGKPMMLHLMPLEFEEYNRIYFETLKEKKNRLNPEACPQIYVIAGTVDQAKAFKTLYGVSEPVLADAKGALFSAFGIAKKNTQTPLTASIDAGQRIVSLITGRNGYNHAHDVFRAIKAAAEPRKTFVIGQIHAPIIQVPNAIDEALTEELLAYWRNGEQFEGDVGRKGNTKVLATQKRRTDVKLEDDKLLARIDDQIAKTVLPELRKVAALDAVCRERYKIGCYGSENEGFYRPHRDTGNPTLAHRRYSMSLMLSDKFEGGHLVFPEYGSVHYRAPKRTALLFPSALLHGVMPVTKGERFVLIAFFYGAAEESYRKTGMYERGEDAAGIDMRLRVQPAFEAVPQSEGLYSATIKTKT